jgi:hypothetical protein
MEHKNDYSVIACFKDSKAKKWSFVHNLNKFSKFLNKDHATWEYFNVYERSTRNFLKRFYPGNDIPPFLSLFLLTFILNLYLTFNGFNNTVTIQII